MASDSDTASVDIKDHPQPSPPSPNQPPPLTEDDLVFSFTAQPASAQTATRRSSPPPPPPAPPLSVSHPELQPVILDEDENLEQVPSAAAAAAEAAAAVSFERPVTVPMDPNLKQLPYQKSLSVDEHIVRISTPALREPLTGNDVAPKAPVAQSKSKSNTNANINGSSNGSIQNLHQPVPLVTAPLPKPNAHRERDDCDGIEPRVPPKQNTISNLPLLQNYDSEKDDNYSPSQHRAGTSTDINEEDNEIVNEILSSTKTIKVRKVNRNNNFGIDIDKKSSADNSSHVNTTGTNSNSGKHNNNGNTSDINKNLTKHTNSNNINKSNSINNDYSSSNIINGSNSNNKPHAVPSSLPLARKKPLNVIEVLRQRKAIREERERRDRQKKQFVDPDPIDVDGDDEYGNDKSKEESHLRTDKSQPRNSGTNDDGNQVGKSTRRPKQVPRQRFEANSNGLDDSGDDFADDNNVDEIVEDESIKHPEEDDEEEEARYRQSHHRNHQQKVGRNKNYTGYDGEETEDEDIVPNVDFNRSSSSTVDLPKHDNWFHEVSTWPHEKWRLVGCCQTMKCFTKVDIGVLVNKMREVNNVSRNLRKSMCRSMVTPDGLFKLQGVPVCRTFVSKVFRFSRGLQIKVSKEEIANAERARILRQAENDDRNRIVAVNEEGNSPPRLNKKRRPSMQERKHNEQNNTYSNRDTTPGVKNEQSDSDVKININNTNRRKNSISNSKNENVHETAPNRHRTLTRKRPLPHKDSPENDHVISSGTNGNSSLPLNEGRRNAKLDRDSNGGYILDAETEEDIIREPERKVPKLANELNDVNVVLDDTDDTNGNSAAGGLTNGVGVDVVGDDEGEDDDDLDDEVNLATLGTGGAKKGTSGKSQASGSVYDGNETSAAIVSFLRRLADNAADKILDSKELRLPFMMRNDVYELFCEEFEKLYDRLKAPSLLEFNTVWKTYCDRIKLRRITRNIEKCPIQRKLQRMMKNLSNNNNSSISKVNYENLVERKRKHELFVASEKMEYRKKKDIILLNSEDAILLIIDASDKLSLGLPQFTKHSKIMKGNSFIFELLTCMEYTKDGYSADVYTLSQELLACESSSSGGGQSSGIIDNGAANPLDNNYSHAYSGDHLVEAVHRFLTARRQREGDKLPRTLYLQLDHCSKKNKNWILLSYMESLVMLGVFEEIHVSFMPDGHGISDMEEVLSPLHDYLLQYDVITLPDALERIEQFNQDTPHDGLQAVRAMNMDKVVNFSGLCRHTQCLSERIVNKLDLSKFTHFRFMADLNLGSAGEVERDVLLSIKHVSDDEWKAIHVHNAPHNPVINVVNNDSGGHGFLRSLPDFQRTPPRHIDASRINKSYVVKRLISETARINDKRKMQILFTMCDDVSMARDEPFHWNSADGSIEFDSVPDHLLAGGSPSSPAAKAPASVTEAEPSQHPRRASASAGSAQPTRTVSSRPSTSKYASETRHARAVASSANAAGDEDEIMTEAKPRLRRRSVAAPIDDDDFSGQPNSTVSVVDLEGSDEIGGDNEVHKNRAEGTAADGSTNDEVIAKVEGGDVDVGLHIDYASHPGENVLYIPPRSHFSHENALTCKKGTVVIVEPDKEQDENKAFWVARVKNVSVKNNANVHWFEPVGDDHVVTGKYKGCYVRSKTTRRGFSSSRGRSAWADTIPAGSILCCFDNFTTDSRIPMSVQADLWKLYKLKERRDKLKERRDQTAKEIRENGQDVEDV